MRLLSHKWRSVACLWALLMLDGCATRVMEEARGQVTYLDPADVPLQVRSASRDARHLYVCVLARNPDGWQHIYTITSELTGKAQRHRPIEDDLPVEHVQRLTSGCLNGGVSVPVFLRTGPGTMSLPPDVREAVFMVAEPHKWSLRYLSSIPTAQGADRYAIDLSATAIYRRYVNGKPYMWMLVPVATAIDAAAVMTLGMISIACGDDLCT